MKREEFVQEYLIRNPKSTRAAAAKLFDDVVKESGGERRQSFVRAKLEARIVGRLVDDLSTLLEKLEKRADLAEVIFVGVEDDLPDADLEAIVDLERFKATKAEIDASIASVKRKVSSMVRKPSAKFTLSRDAFEEDEEEGGDDE